MFYVLSMKKFTAGYQVWMPAFPFKLGDYEAVTSLDHLVEKDIVPIYVHLANDSLVLTKPYIALLRR